jgi:hypothetical protein
MTVVLQSDRKSVKYLLRLLSPAPGETHSNVACTLGAVDAVL